MAPLVARLPDQLKVIATFSVGYEHIDVAACRTRGIVAANAPGTMTEATADIALLLMLGAARRGWEAQSMVRRGDWKGWDTMMLLGIDLAGKRLGIRSEEHTSELQSLMRISYAVFCLKKKNNNTL